MIKEVKVPKNKYLIGLYDNILTTPLNYMLSTSKFIANIKSEEEFYLGRNTVSDNLCILSEESEIFNKEEYTPKQVDLSVYIVDKVVFEYLLAYYDCKDNRFGKNISELSTTKTPLGNVYIIKYINHFYVKNI